MRILHINSYYSGRNFYKHLYNYQVSMGYEIKVFVPVHSRVEDQIEYGSYAIISKNHSKLDRFAFHLKVDKIYKDLLRKCNVSEYSVVHAHSLFVNGFVAMTLKDHFNIPYVVSVRNTDVNVFFKRLVHLRRTGLKILENANQIIFISDSYKRQVLSQYVPVEKRQMIADKISVITNGIDDFWFENFPNRKYSEPNLDLNQRTIRLLHVGDINRNKNIQTTLQAIEILRKGNNRVVFEVVGAVKNQSIFASLLDLPYVNYLGFRNREELLGIYRNNDILVLPSIYETFGLVYAEAMSQGLPVIYTRGQGFDGQFEDGLVGYAVDSHNPSEIADRILQIYENYRAISEACLLHSKNYSWDIIGESISNVYKSCIEC